MSHTYSTPSAEFPGAPAVALEVPDDWSPGPAGPTALAVLGPEQQPGFRANVVVTTQRLALGVGLDELAAGVRARVDQLVEVHLVLDRVVDVADRPAHLVQYTYRHPDAGAVAQSLLTVPVAHQGVTDLVEVVGTMGGDQVARDAEVVARVMQSVTIA